MIYVDRYLSVSVVLPFSSGRDANQHWVPRIEKAASYCRFSAHSDMSPPGQNDSTYQPSPTNGNISYISFHTDPDGHINLASCPVPSWLLDSAPHDGAAHYRVELILRSLTSHRRYFADLSQLVSLCESCHISASQYDLLAATDRLHP